jgi:hypothetical protein
VGKPEGKRQIGRRDDNIKMDVRKLEWGRTDLIRQAYDTDQRAESCVHCTHLLSSMKYW